MAASQMDRNGVWTLIEICPAAATIRLMAERTVGWDVRASEGEVGSYGASSDGKSSGEGNELAWSWAKKGADPKLVSDGDGGGDAYACPTAKDDALGVVWALNESKDVFGGVDGGSGTGENDEDDELASR